jgi:uncharacterized protein (DUF58 family)
MKPLFKAVYGVYRLFSFLKRWWNRRFTRAGKAIVVAVVLTAILGPDTDNSVAYQAFTVLSVLLTIAVCFSWFFRVRFSIRRLLPEFGTVGTPLRYTLLAKNLTRKPQAGLVLLEDLADPRPSFQDWLAMQLADEKHTRSFRVSQARRTHPFRVAKLKEMTVPPAAPDQELTLRSELLPLRRGVLRLSGITLARADPLGLFRALVKVPLPQTTLILPKRYPLPPIALPGTVKYQEGGVALASHVGESEEFVSLRDYRQGDPLRHIHWRSWARVGRPVVKEFEDEFFVRHAMVLDTFVDDPQSEAFEEAVSVAASFACTIPEQESLLDLLFVGPKSYCFTAGRGLAHSDQMLQILASVRVCTELQFATLEHLVLNHVAVLSGCICIFLVWDQERRNFVSKLLSLGLPVLVLVVMEPEKSNDLDPGPMRDTPDKFHVLQVGQIEEGVAALR